MTPLRRHVPSSLLVLSLLVTAAIPVGTQAAQAQSNVILNSLQITFVGAYLTADPSQTPLVYFDDYDVSAPYVAGTYVAPGHPTNTGTGSSDASGDSSLDGGPVNDWGNVNDFYEVGSPPIVVNGQTQAQSVGAGSKFSSSFVTDLSLGVGSYLYDDLTNDPLDVTVVFGYAFDWTMDLSRDAPGQASGFVQLEYSIDSGLSDPFARTTVYDAAFGAGLNFPVNIDETVNEVPPGPASGLFAIALGGADYADIQLHVTVASYTTVDASPVPLPAGALMLVSGLCAMVARGGRRRGA